MTNKTGVTGAGVLSGVRVVDFGRYVAAPYCATLLGYLGADVIRVERIGGGEDRFIAPLSEDAGAVFLQTACNKRSVCLSLKSAEGRDVRDRLIETADVVVSNFPPHAQRKAGMDYASLKALRDDIILANVSSFGASGPLATQGGFDGVGQAMSGAMHTSGTPGNPAKAAAPYVDYSTAVLTAFGVMAALRERDQSGRGQEIASSLLGTALAVFNSHLIEEGALALGREGSGNRVQTSGPSDVLATRDGHVLVHCPGDAIFKRIATLIDRPEWLDDTRFATDQSRGEWRDELCAPLAQWCALRTTQVALDELSAAGVPAGPVLTPADALAHPQVDALGVLGQVLYPGAPAAAPVADLPFSMSQSENGIRQRPPTPGEHTDQVLEELGFDAQRRRALREGGAVA
ncbi:MAG: CaiB/BaiF CoA transferase family protein [Gammaproteobacteria bacterium]